MNKNWSSKSLGSKLQHAIFYKIIELGGWRAGYCLLFVVVCWYCCMPSVRLRSSYYLRRRFPNAGKWALLHHCWRLNWSFGKALVDRAEAGISGKLSTSASDQDKVKLQKTSTNGKGMILISAHVGCWQTAMLALHELLPHPVNVALYQDASDNDKQYFEHGVAANFNIIDPQYGLASTVAMLQALQRGEILTVMGDRAFGDANTAQLAFLGGTISLPWSIYYLASVSGAPIVVCFALRAGPCKVHYHIAQVLHVPAKLGKNAVPYRIYLEQYVAALEDITRKAPYQFFNFYNMWKDEA